MPGPEPELPSPEPSQLLNTQSCSSQSTTESPSSPDLPIPTPLTPFRTPSSKEEWEDLAELAQCLVPTVLAATSPEEKNAILCQGMYGCMVSKFGTRRNKYQTKSRKRAHERKLKNLRREKSEAKRALKQARRQPQSEGTVRELSVKFHRLLRLHSKAKKASLKARLNLEALTAPEGLPEIFLEIRISALQ